MLKSVEDLFPRDILDKEAKGEINKIQTIEQSLEII